MALNVVLDGWALVYAPGSPAALHLLTILAHLPKDVHPVLALPDRPPAWLGTAEFAIRPAANSARGRLSWEQRLLPALASEKGANLLHLMTLTPPLFGTTPVVISPATPEPARQPGGVDRPRLIADRLRRAAALGGVGRARGVFWPQNLPERNFDPPLTVYRLPPVGGRDLALANPQEKTPDLPETFVLYHGPQHPDALHTLLEGWSWAAASLGTYYPLLILPWDEAGRAAAAAFFEPYGAEAGVQVLGVPHPGELATIYQSASAVFHPVESTPWAGAVQLALSYARPLAALDTAQTDALVGPAAYLAPAAGRSLGAALITVIVEEEVAENLSQAARQRAAGWRGEDFGRELALRYQQVLGLQSG